MNCDIELGMESLFRFNIAADLFLCKALQGKEPPMEPPPLPCGPPS